MLTIIIRKYKVSAIALLSLLMLMIPHSVAAQAGNAEDGQKLYEKNCASCHAPDGSASTAIGKAVAAKDLRSAETLKLTDDQIATQISQGKGNMPPFGGSLNKSNVNDLIAYVRELGKKQPAVKKPG